MFSKIFTKQTIGLFAVVFVLAFIASAPVVFEDTTSKIENAVASAWGSSCGGCGDPDPGPGGEPGGDPAGDPPGAFIRDCMDPAATNYNPGADGHDQSKCIYASPSCDSFTATPSTVTLGDSVQIAWNTSNAKKVRFSYPSGYTDVAPDSSQVAWPRSDVTYKLTVYGHDGSEVTCTAPVKVVKPTPDPTCDAFTATPNSITKGENVTLKWNTSHATKVTLTRPHGDYVVAVDGSEVVSPWGDFTFKLKVEGNGKTVYCSAPVKVKQPTPAPTCDAFTATPTKLPVGGGKTVLKWSTTKADSVTIDQGIGAVPVDNTSGKSVFVNKTKVFTLTAKNVSGTDTCTVKVVVDTPNPTPTCDAFTATPSTIKKGESTTLTWSTSNASYVTLTRPNGTEKVSPDGKMTISPNSDFTFVITVYSANDKHVTCTAPVKVKQPISAPSCDSFTATPSTIKKGESTVIAWNTSNATKVDLKLPAGVVTVASEGRDTVSLNKDHTFVLTVYGVNNQKVTCAAPVTVKQPNPLTCAKNVTFTANPNQLPVGGGNVTLKWAATGVDLISINKGVLPTTKNLTGKSVVSVAQDTTYTLTATRGNESIQCPVSVTVDTKQPKDVTCAANAGFVANPTKLPYGGGSVELSWDTTKVKEVKLDGVAVARKDKVTKNVTTDTTFKLKITGNNNTTGNTVVCPITVTVEKKSTGISCAANVKTWRASDNDIARGSDVTLTWEATGLDTIEINNGVLSKTTDLTGSETVRPTSDTRYVLTGKKGTQTITCELDIDVRSSGGGGGSSSPRCDLDASKTSIKAGEEITLSWDNRYTRDLTIFEGDEDDGTKIFETDDDDLVDEGSIKVRPTKNTTYTLLVERGSKDRTCDVDIKVKDDVVLSSTRDQGLVAGISLTSVPYTGFEAGPMLTFIFYALLAIWGLFVAYILVVRGNNVAGVSLAGAHPKNPIVGSDYSTSAVEGDRQTSEAAAYVGAVLATPRTPVDPPASLPTNLPVGEAPVVGYQAVAETAVAPSVTADEADQEIKALEDRAHDQHVLLSSDALRELIMLCPRTIGRLVYLDMIIAEAKITYPSEDGWVVLNQQRVENICHKRNNALAKEAVPTTVSESSDTPAPVVPTGSGSLAEAMVTGNIAAAYQMIGNRPMIALADAAADLDSVYRARKGETVAISDMLQSESARLTDDQIKEAISALTSAIDGVYNDESEAVKMSIMKAVKALN